MRITFVFHEVHSTSSYEKFKKHYLGVKPQLAIFKKFIMDLNAELVYRQGFTMCINFDGKQDEADCLLDLIMMEYPILSFEIFSLKRALKRNFYSFDPLTTKVMYVTLNNTSIIPSRSEKWDLPKNFNFLERSIYGLVNLAGEVEVLITDFTPIERKKGIATLFSFSVELPKYTDGTVVRARMIVNLKYNKNTNMAFLDVYTDEYRDKETIKEGFLEGEFTLKQLAFFCKGMDEAGLFSTLFGQEFKVLNYFLGYTNTVLKGKL